MKPSSILRKLSFKVPVRSLSSPAVAPLPVRSSFDRRVTAEIDTLLGSNSLFPMTAEWLLQALDVSIATQIIVQESLLRTKASSFGDFDRSAIEEYLEESTEQFDACNSLLDKLEAIGEYLDLLSVALHLVGGNLEPNPAALARARVKLSASSKAVQRQYKRKMNKTSSSSLLLSLRRRQRLPPDAILSSSLGEILSGSTAVASIVCGAVGIALSFSLKNSGSSSSLVLPPLGTACWSSSLRETQQKVKEKAEKYKKKTGLAVMPELRNTVMAATDLENLIKSKESNDNNNELRFSAEELKRRCEELEQGVEPFESKIKELYRHLIAVRMVLLGILSQPS